MLINELQKLSYLKAYHFFFSLPAFLLDQNIKTFPYKLFSSLIKEAIES